jgi:cation diffusion facilitator CzcD-associated flavoprotein CzcO
MGSIEPPKRPDYDVLVIGAGLSGCYACYRMRQLGVKVKVLETGSSVGRTWFWSKIVQLSLDAANILSNMGPDRYPGARFDCESYTYGFFFSQELSTNGHGRSTSRHKKKRRAILDLFATSTAYGKTYISTLEWTRPIELKRTVVGN